MSEAKFTKGEWSIERIVDQAHIVSSFDGDNKAICAVSTYGCSDNSIRNANAHLIASAPEMYEMLELAVCQLFDHPSDSNKKLIKDIVKLRKRARGES